MMPGDVVKAAVAVVLVCALGGCDKLGVGTQALVADGAPAPQELQKIGYMSSVDSAAEKRKLYSHYEEAKTCGDFELAMRWNRPPNVAGGPFHKKMIYLSSTIPRDLPKNSEVFITAKVEKGEMLPSGSAVWLLRMPDGTAVQAIETANFWEKEEQATQDGKYVAIVSPNTPGREFCGQAVYEGAVGKDSGSDKVPVISALFAMDRSS